MPQNGLIYRILIASPSDCIQERKAIPEVIYSWNAVNSLKTSAILEPVLWETHSTPELGDRPQAILNKQLVENCDILVGVFWTRLGTHTGESESGTTEEIEEFRKAGKPVLIYFSSVPVHPDSIDVEQYKLLTEYKKRLQKEGLVSTYDSIGDLRDKIQRHISSTITSIHEGTKTDQLDENDTETDEGIEQVNILKSQFESFLRRFEAEWTAEKESSPVNIYDGKYMIENAFSEVVNYLSMIVNDDETNLSSLLQEASKRLKVLSRHELFIDGNQSYNAFWTEGDDILKLMKKIPIELETILKKSK